MRLHRIAAEHANVHDALRRRQLKHEGEQVSLHRVHLAQAQLQPRAETQRAVGQHEGLQGR